MYDFQICLQKHWRFIVLVFKCLVESHDGSGYSKEQDATVANKLHLFRQVSFYSCLIMGETQS